MCAIQSIMVKTYPKSKEINEITCYLYPCGLLFGTNIKIASIIFYLDLCYPPNPEVPNINFVTTYNVVHDKNQPIFYLKGELCREFNQVEIVEHGLH